MTAGLPLDAGQDEDGGAPQRSGNAGGPATAGQPSGDSKPTTDADAGAGSPQTPGKDDGAGKPDAEDEAEVNGLLQSLGLKPEAKADGKGEAAAAAKANEKPTEGDNTKLVAEIEKAINPDGNVPLDQQVKKAVAMAAAGQHQIGKLGNEVGVYRNLFDQITERGYFDGIAEGRLEPNMVKLVDALPPEKFMEQIQTEEAQQKLAKIGVKIVPLEYAGDGAGAGDPMARFEQAAAAKLVPDPKLSHEERLAVIAEDDALKRRLPSMTAAEMMRAEAQAGAKGMQSEAKLLAARQEVGAALAAMEKNNPDLWQELGPAIARHGAKLPATLDHMEGMQFAISRAFYELSPKLIADAYAKGKAAGRKLGQGDAGMLVAPGSSGGGARARSRDDAGDVVSAEDRAKAGLPPVER